MDAKIDYLSWSVLVDVRGAGDELQMWLRIVNVMWDQFPDFMTWAAAVQGWQSGGARGHYAFSQYNRQFFSSVRFGGTANHILVELPGTACQSLRDQGCLDGVVQAAADRLTRLDLAVDVKTDTSPRQFVQAGYNERFKSYAEIVSESGETEYVGSMKSERYARVYKYSAPHPRAGMLRIESVLRSDYAKSAAQIYAQSGLLVLAATCGNSFGWRSALWQPDSLTDGKLKATRADRHEPGRVRWLHQVVFPALVKAHKDGLIDLREWCSNLLQGI